MEKSFFGGGLQVSCCIDDFGPSFLIVRDFDVVLKHRTGIPVEENVDAIQGGGFFQIHLPPLRCFEGSPHFVECHPAVVGIGSGIGVLAFSSDCGGFHGFPRG